MCAQPRNADQPNDDRADVPAPVDDQKQEGPASASSTQSRRRSGAGRTGRNLVVRGVRRDPPDMRKLARVIASLAADMVAADSREQPPPAEPDDGHRDHLRDAA
ncbi:MULTISPECIES: hypothetical protein [Amycolatopsis]|uniref:Uncharacterized protein n=1 Tax=Amycolatopsis albidoflavus TaxID=102226 RepID=A0ABW5ICV2_9PSEU